MGEVTHGNLAALRRSGTATRRNLNTGFYKYAHAIYLSPHPNPPEAGGEGVNQVAGVFYDAKASNRSHLLPDRQEGYCPLH
jgi:hypothetical protein